ncbi:MAG: hypothetical protein VX265_14970 [Myxococcota bacterium]|nr:hypothetical protein [Myxococcota bacterium]
MPVICMECVAKMAHEKTDSLFIYTFRSPLLGDKTIVANLTNVYAVGDRAGIAQLGTFLPGMEMKPRKVFGIDSEGMAMGPVDAELDADLSSQFDADAPLRSFRVTLEVEVEARYPDDCRKLAQKAVKSGRFEVSTVH